jgi:hypothetical protein
MPQQTRMKIMVGHFTVCNFYSLMKTRLSLSDYKEVGAIVAGTLNEDVC